VELAPSCQQARRLSRPAAPDFRGTRPAETSIDALFLERWSPRAFAGEAVPRADLMTMIEAARWARSRKSASIGWSAVRELADVVTGGRISVELAPSCQQATTSANSRTADHPIDALFLERWSPRAFAGEAVPRAVFTQPWLNGTRSPNSVSQAGVSQSA
jgi:hypothetical protein